MKSFNILLKETNQTMRQARAYTDSLISNAEKIGGLLTGKIPHYIGGDAIITSAKNALDKKSEMWNSVVEASNRIGAYEVNDFNHLYYCRENLLKLIQSYSLQITDAHAILSIFYNEYLKTRSK